MDEREAIQNARLAAERAEAEAEIPLKADGVCLVCGLRRATDADSERWDAEWYETGVVPEEAPWVSDLCWIEHGAGPHSHWWGFDEALARVRSLVTPASGFFPENESQG